ncbi:MAG TPA: hypothetical protein VIO61_14190 [Anaerolineaceae bacterium]
MPGRVFFALFLRFCVIVLLPVVSLLAGFTDIGHFPKSRASAMMATQLLQLSPSTCPIGGCAGGQRINFRADYDLGSTLAAASPNVRVCVYARDLSDPANDWALPGSLVMDASGGISGQGYTSSAGCPAVTDFKTLGGAQASLSSGFPADSLGFAFRINPAANANGSVFVRIEYYTGTPLWSVNQVFLPSIPATPSTAQVFVANDPTACGSSMPCYVNSGYDQSGGLGTGLKDAVDAVNPLSTITILDGYLVKSQAVLINKAVTIQGSGNSSISYGGPASACSNPVLEITAGATLKTLTVSDGACTTPFDRNLVAINSTEPVLLESNTLTGGKDGVAVTDNTGNLTLRFNHITGNSGYAVRWQSTTPGGTGRLDAVGNNLYGNQNGVQVECDSAATTANSNRLIDHNYLGTSLTGSHAHCTAADSKRLGAPIVPNSGAPGANAALVTVRSSKQYAFNNLVGFQWSSSGTIPDFPLYIVNHGQGTVDHIPFTGVFGADLSACSNYWDVFLGNPDMATADVSLNLFFNYNLNPNCKFTIDSIQYCSSTDAARYPLWWYDPTSPPANATEGWDTTGQPPSGPGASGATGQTTSCSISDNEIKVIIDTSGRPDLAHDLDFTAFVVGTPLVSYMGATPGNGQITLQWTTQSETNISGYYVQSSTSPNGPFSDVSPFKPAQGTAPNGYGYSFVHTGLSNNTTYYYRLRMMNSSQTGYLLSRITSATPSAPTPTPTATKTATRTITSTPTISSTPTETATDYPTVTLTPYVYYGPTWTPYRSPTRTPTRTRTVSGTPPTATVSGTPRTSTPTITRTLTISAQPGTRTNTGTATLTPPDPIRTGTITPTGDISAGIPRASGASPRDALLSLVIGGVFGIFSAAAIGFGLWRSGFLAPKNPPASIPLQDQIPPDISG